MIRFGTDGVRGLAGEAPIDEATFAQIGAAAAEHAKPADGTPPVILVGRDTRGSSPGLARAAATGAASAGAEVMDLGVVTTPGVAYLTERTGAAIGLIVTASHNPHIDNGIKFVKENGGKPSEFDKLRIAELASQPVAAAQTGSVQDGRHFVQKYEDFLVDSAGPSITFEGLSIALDCANGAASEIAPRVFKRLGAQVVALAVQPDGNNINKESGATHTNNLQGTVVSEGLDLGFGFDGDADRVVMVDHKGKILDGDDLLYLLGVTDGHHEIVATQMTNEGLALALQQHGIRLHRTAMGDRAVAEGMQQTAATLGGEQSGHIIQSKYLATGDGILTAVHAIRALLTSGKTAAEWRTELDTFRLPQMIVNVRLHDNSWVGGPAAQEIIAQEINNLDGKGRLNVRASGTEPLLRVMVEAPDAAERAAAIGERLASLAELSEQGLRFRFDRQPELEEQLIVKSCQPHILANTPRDAQERFADPQAVEKWMQKGRTVHWLTNEAANQPDLAGIMWYGEEALPGGVDLPDGLAPPNTTMAIRLYEGYAGNGLSRKVMRESLFALAGRLRAEGKPLPVNGIWLQTDASNAKALASYRKFGYQEVGRDKEGRITMILPAQTMQTILHR